MCGTQVSLVRIISRYVLKEHVGPFVFALSALTSLLLLQYIARRFGDLVGRGLSWQIIPTLLPKLLSDKDPRKSQSVMKAMLQMKKIDSKKLQQAYDQA